MLEALHQTALRLFNGFTEGCPEIAIDLYGETAVINNYSDPPAEGEPLVRQAQETLKFRLPWLRAAVLKTRSSPSIQERHGRLLFGSQPAGKVIEHGVWYAVDLSLSRDASLYLDTRNLRLWALNRLKGKTALNVFAYTGSLGVAALSGGASRVLQLDRSRQFLDIAKRSCALNGLPVRARDFMQADFFQSAARFRRAAKRFDCVFIDPPFFASSPTGRVDQVHDSARMINKVRPLVSPEGYLVAVNNALYVSGADYMATLEGLCADGHLRLVETIPVPDDFVGLCRKPIRAPLPDPAPFNHATKIAILQSTS